MDPRDALHNIGELLGVAAITLRNGLPPGTCTQRLQDFNAIYFLIDQFHQNCKIPLHLRVVMAQQPDLQSILATLAQYSQNASIQTPPPAPNEQGNALDSTASVAVQNNTVAATRNSNADAIPTDPRLRGRTQSRSVTPSHAQALPQPQAPSIIDPATITVWQDGLRCVTKIAAQNKMFEASIRRVSCLKWFSQYCAWAN